MLSAIVSGLWSRFSGYAVAIAAALAILFGVYRKGGADAAARQAQTRLNEINKARKVEHEIDRLGGDDIDRRLSKWVRDQ